MTETTASMAVAASVRDNDERAAMRAQSSVRFTTSLRCAFGRRCSTMHAVLSSARRSCGPTRPGPARERAGDVVERGVDDALVAGIELDVAVEIPKHVGEVEKSCHSVWNIDLVTGSNGLDYDRGRATVRPSALPGAAHSLGLRPPQGLTAPPALPERVGRFGH